MFAIAAGSDVTLCKSTYRHSVVHRLQQRIGVRIKNMGLEAAMLSLIVEAVGPLSATSGLRATFARTRSQNLRHQTSNTQSQLCDTHVGYRMDATGRLENQGVLALRPLTVSSATHMGIYLTHTHVILLLLNLPSCLFLPPPNTMLRFPLNSLGRDAYPTKSNVFMVLRTCAGMRAGGGYAGTLA
jgi:hypothetical protein